MDNPELSNDKRFGCDYLSFSNHLITKLVIEKNTFICPDIDCYFVTFRPQWRGHGMNYCMGHSSIFGYDLGNRFAKLFHFPLPLARNKLQWWPLILCYLHYTIGALGMILKKVFFKISGPGCDPFTSNWNHDKAEKF